MISFSAQIRKFWKTETAKLQWATLLNSFKWMNAGPVYYRYKVDAAYHMSFLALSIRYLENNKKKKIVSNNTFSFATFEPYD